jgi:hypothetical protein
MGLKPRRETVKKEKERPQGNGLFFGKKFFCPPHESIVYHITAETDKFILIEWIDFYGYRKEIRYTIDEATKYINDCSWKLI